ncbi:MAG: hypothetical protein M3O33_03315 [Cyanobacteriota bacterium]|nr:hypothetical protein [Cyanobacteriota bacterium]
MAHHHPQLLLPPRPDDAALFFQAFFSSGVNHTYAQVVLFFVRVMNDFQENGTAQFFLNLVEQAVES